MLIDLYFPLQCGIKCRFWIRMQIKQLTSANPGSCGNTVSSSSPSPSSTSTSSTSSSTWPSVSITVTFATPFLRSPICPLTKPMPMGALLLAQLRLGGEAQLVSLERQPVNSNFAPTTVEAILTSGGRLVSLLAQVELMPIWGGKKGASRQWSYCCYWW